MADHALTLMQAIEAILKAQVPLAGGWLSTRLETPTYPVGFIDLTSSDPGHGNNRYTEDHRGVISVWSQKTLNKKPHPAEAFKLSAQAREAISQASGGQGGLIIRKLKVGTLVPVNRDGITWGRSFVFTATTYEA